MRTGTSSQARPRGNSVRAEREAKEWNKAHRVGAKVSVKDDDGTKRETTTRSMSWEVGGHAVILLEGMTGGYLLNRVTAL